jgi:hypothetical protein
MKNLNKLPTDKLQSVKKGMIRAVNNAILDDTERYILSKKIEELSNEIGKRLQLTLDFNEEPEDGAYYD